MTAEQRLKLLIGELHVTIAQLQAQVEMLQTQSEISNSLVEDTAKKATKEKK